MSDEYDGKDLESLNNKLFMSTGCEAQGPEDDEMGWPCNTCFHTTIDADHGKELKEDVHEYWLAVLAFRGDYPELPEREDLLIELNRVMD